MSCAEALVTNYQSTLCNMPEERISHFHGSGDLQSRRKKIYRYPNTIVSNLIRKISEVQFIPITTHRGKSFFMYLHAAPYFCMYCRPNCKQYSMNTKVSGKFYAQQ